MSGIFWKLFTWPLFAKRKNEFVFAEPFLKINSANSLQSTFARIVSDKAKQTELVHCPWEPCYENFPVNFSIHDDRKMPHHG